LTDDYDLRILSLGGGVQSSCMYLMAARGDITLKPDYAIFADTQAEPKYVYENLDRLEKLHGATIPILRPTAGSLYDAVVGSAHGTGPGDGRFAAVPFWTLSNGVSTPGRRQCTREYKIDVVKREIRRLLGLKPGARALGRFRVEQWIGISTDEAQRAKPSRDKWLTSRWPLLYDVPMRRSDCAAYIETIGFPMPEKSSCLFCPWRLAQAYRRMKELDPEAFQRALGVDELLSKPQHGTKHKQWIHRSLRPLRDVVEDVEDDPQLDLFGNECEGMCGV